MTHFKLDENVPLQLVTILKIAKHTATSVFSEKISGIDDERLVTLCQRKEYVLVTLDTDFTNIYHYPPATYKGIIVLRLKNQGVTSVLKAFQSLLQKIDLETIAHSLIIVENERIRIRT